jgi:hypothetical protein
MIFALYAIIVPATLGLVLILVARTLRTERYDDVVVLGALLGLAAWLAIGTMMFIGGLIQQKVTRDVCARFAVESGFETRWVRYNHLTMDCLVATDDGGWVPRDALRKVVDP